MVSHHVWLSRRLSHVQRTALHAIADGRVHAIGAPTMRVLVEWKLIEDVKGAPQIALLGLEVLDETPEGRMVATSVP
jgi:hypothetical protein